LASIRRFRHLGWFHRSFNDASERSRMESRFLFKNLTDSLPGKSHLGRQEDM
jgi:hypothetical protein